MPPRTAPRRAHFLPTSLALAVAAACTPALAQESAGRIEITGSLIKRVSAETAVPVSTARAEDLQARGHTELKDFMLELPQASSLGTNAGTAGPMTNLRGFGPMRTLTLLNGRRLAKEPLTNQYVSVSVMPRMAMSRVEVLRDGASSAYGSDAISGVQAFYTQPTYQGARIKIEGMQPQQSGGGDYWSAGAIAGFGDLETNGWNVYVAGELQRRRILPREARPELINPATMALMGIATTPTSLSNNTNTSNGFAAPGNFRVASSATANTTTSGTVYNPYGASGCVGGNSKPLTIAGQPICYLDSNDTYTAWGNGNDIGTVYGKGTVRLGQNHQVSLELNHGEYKVLQRNAPTPVNVRLTSAHPFYPGNGITPLVSGLTLGGRPIDVAWSVADAGPRDRGDYHSNSRAVLEFSGSLGKWDYRSALNVGKAERETKFENGWLRLSGIGTMAVPGSTTNTAFLLDSRLNPFGAQTAAGSAVLQAASLNGTTYRLHRSTNSSVDVTLTGEAFKLPAGPAMLAVGAELRRDGWEAVGLATGDGVTSLNGLIDVAGGDNAAQGANTRSSNKITRDITSVFAELEMPLTKTLSVNAAVRGDQYKDLSETTVNPKVSVRWAPERSVVVRASANTGFRAPALPEIYSKETELTALATFNDPVNCPSGTAINGFTAAQVCGLTGRSQVTKIPGNSGISPEKSNSWTAGVVFEPIKNLTTSIDYWETEITDVIGNRSISFILANPGIYADLYRRNADGTLATNAVFNPPSNLGKLRGAGFDVSVNWALPQWPGVPGRFSLGLEGAYLTRWDASSPEVAGGAWRTAIAQYNDVVPVNPNAGISNNTRGLNNRWRHTAQVAWSMGPWRAVLSQRYQSQIADQNSATRVNAVGSAGVRNVASYEQYNLAVNYTGFKNWNLGFSVLNLTDRNPPETNHTGYNGYLTSIADVLGRSFRATVDVKF